MALATTALAEARVKLDMAHAEAQPSVGRGMAQEALQAASEALVAARRGNNSESKLAALEIVVQANMYIGDYFAANLAATDELAMIQRTGDKADEAKALQLVADVHVARGDNVGASNSLQTAISLQEELKDRAGQAKSLRQLAMAYMAGGKKEKALKPAQDALKIYEELNDSKGAQTANRTVNMVYAERGQVDKAPNRAEALLALEALQAAVNDEDGQAWNQAMEELTNTCAYTQNDIDAMVERSMDKDRSRASAFLRDRGLAVKLAGENVLHMMEMNKTMQYISFRLGGLGYGPSFQCLRAYKKQVGTDINSLKALACLQCSEEAQDWEQELQYHPGILDGMLQSSSAYA